MNGGFHRPVLEEQAVKFLVARKGGVYVDCTLGGGGHSFGILNNTASDAFLVGIDADPEAIAYATDRLSSFPNKYLRNIFYDQLEVVLYEAGKYPVDGVLYDLGISSWQIDQQRRGFSFRGDGELDMRFGSAQKNSAADVLNTYPREDLERIIREFGEERHWRAIARDIVERRARGEIRYVGELTEIVRNITGERFLNKSLARVFQAIRIEVNNELDRLKASLESAFQMLRQGGRIVVISYHSLEDRIVKNFMKEKNKSCVCPPELPTCMCDKVQELKLLTRKPMMPDAEEIAENSRARSAKMRVAEKVVPYTGEGMA